MAKNDCCRTDGSVRSGILFGLIPHAGCIAFIVFSVLGAVAFAGIFRPLLMNANMFYGLVAVSLIFASVSALFYLRSRGGVSLVGARRDWKYLATLYGTTIGINILLILVVFPLVATQVLAQGQLSGDEQMVVLLVDIPCSGHVPLISGDLYGLDGVVKVDYAFPDVFTIYYDEPATIDQMLALEIFGYYPARVR